MPLLLYYPPTTAIATRINYKPIDNDLLYFIEQCVGYVDLLRFNMWKDIPMCCVVLCCTIEFSGIKLDAI